MQRYTIRRYFKLLSCLLAPKWMHGEFLACSRPGSRTIDAHNSLPKYWTIPKQAAEVDYHAATRDELAFDELMYVKHKDMRYFQERMPF